MGRGGVAPDEVGDLLQGAGAGDVDALAPFYERTSPLVFNLLNYALGELAAAERATVRVYVHVWRTAPAFDPASMSGCTFLLRAVHRELDGRRRRTGT